LHHGAAEDAVGEDRPACPRRPGRGDAVSSRIVVVTGGGKGIGRAVVARFAAAGDRVVAVGRDRSALEESDAAATEVCDVTDEGSVDALFNRIGRVDVLVNN